MSTVSNAAEKTARWIERGSDLANPILVRETRQALKSRQFVATFLLLLAAAWVVSSFFMLWRRDALEYGAVAMELFVGYYFVLALAIFVIVPFTAFRSLLNENDLNTFDLLSITSLSPSQIVWGKLWTAIVQIFIFYSAIAPFMAFTALLNGFDVAKFSFVLVASNLAAIAASLVALTLSTFAKQRHWQALSSLVLLGGLIWMFMAAVGAIFWFRPAFDDPDFWWGVGAISTLVLSYLALCHQITTAQLTFESDNRSSGIRIVASVQIVLYIVGLAAFFWTNKIYPPPQGLLVLAILAFVHLGAVGLFAATESEALSRRVRRNLPRNGLLRLITVPYLPGGSRGLLYFLGHAALLLFTLEVVLEMFGTRIVGRWGGVPVTVLGIRLAAPMPIVLTLAMYMTVFLCIASFLSRLGQRISADLRPAHARVVTVLVFMAGVLLPFLPRMMEWMPWRGFSILDLFNPVLTIQHIERSGGDSELVIVILAVVTVVSVLANSAAILGGIQHVMGANVAGGMLDDDDVEILEDA